MHRRIFALYAARCQDQQPQFGSRCPCAHPEHRPPHRVEMGDGPIFLLRPLPGHRSNLLLPDR
ncbi:hypothetical protein EVA_08365 [gut metagenome]|uniref:Uncharacterized protein n=1 Tax=gut metagenome TaxID=749906 RepID=J9GMR6_9ZZZZ